MKELKGKDEKTLPPVRLWGAWGLPNVSGYKVIGINSERNLKERMLGLLWSECAL